MGLIKNKVYYTYTDVTILPGVISDIEHRKECIPLDENGMLPLFTAPMDTVVDEHNYQQFTDEMVYAILPRTVSFDTRLSYSIKNRWAAYSLVEFEIAFCTESNKLDESNGIKVLIDIANGHMKKVLDLIRAAKNIYGQNITIMVGNIANPYTFEKLSKAGADFIRCGIGSGCGCLSTSNTGIHMPMVSLIDEIATIKKDLNLKAKIVADGGIRNYSDIIKAIAVGADYVMVGSVFAKMFESAAPKYPNSEDWVEKPLGVELRDLENIHKEGNAWYGSYNHKEIFLGDISLKFYGMASKQGQIALNGTKTKTSEGLMKTLQVEYTMHGWCMNFIDYLRSAMSYVGVKTLDDFRRESVVIINSPNAVSAVNK